MAIRRTPVRRSASTAVGVSCRALSQAPASSRSVASCASIGSVAAEPISPTAASPSAVLPPT
jgi:hypothetical protein